MSDAIDPGTLLEQALQALSRGVADRHHPARHPTLATMGSDGPMQRTVVLRAFDRDATTLEVHTDSASSKVAELRADPRAALHIWIPRQKLQLRLSATVTLVPSDPHRWDKVPTSARVVYGGTPVPGTQMTGPNAFQPAPDIARFTALVCTLTRFEVLHLADDGHQRVRFDRVDQGWNGTWIAP